MANLRDGENQKLLTLQSNHSCSLFLAGSVSFILSLCLLPTCAGASSSSESPSTQSDEGLRFDLPANGNLRVENLRGGIIVEIGKQNYVTVSAISDHGQQKVSPAIVQRTEGLLSVRVSRGMADASRINLVLTIPERSHAAILTRNGSVEVRGLPAALLVQTVSGEIRVEAPANAGADVMAQSRTGNVTSSLPSANSRGASAAAARV